MFCVTQKIKCLNFKEIFHFVQCMYIQQALQHGSCSKKVKQNDSFNQQNCHPSLFAISFIPNNITAGGKSGKTQHYL